MKSILVREREYLKSLKPQIIKKPRNNYPKDINPIYKRYLISSRAKGLILEYTEQELIELIAQPCNYCNTPNANGIDKINPKGHYTKDNCVPCCKMCNTMKFVYTTEQFLAHVRRIYEFNAIQS